MVYSQTSQLPMRERIWNVLVHGKGTVGSLYTVLLVTCIILSLAVLPLEFMPVLSKYHDVLVAIEIITTILFTAEYILHIYAAPKRAKYIFSFYGIVDLLSILPFFLGFLGTQYVRAFRLLRLIRLIRLGEIEGARADDARASRLNLAPGETIDYVVSMHPIYFIIGCLPPILSCSIALGILLYFGENIFILTLSLALFLFAILFIWKTWLDYRYDVIYVTTRRLIWQNQYLLGRSINQVNYHAITNVKPYFGTFFGYVLRYGSIKIETNAAETGHTELHMVRDHEKAAHIIMQRTYGSMQGQHHANPHAQTPHPPAPPQSPHA